MPVKIGNALIYGTKEACGRIGRSKDAVFLWIREKRIPDVGRDRRGHRVWTESDIQRFRQYALSISRGNKQSFLFQEGK